MFRDTLALVWETGRFALTASWCGMVTAGESLLTRCSARSEEFRQRGVIGLALTLSLNLADFLWGRLPCAGYQPLMRVNTDLRPCGCEEEE